MISGVRATVHRPVTVCQLVAKGIRGAEAPKSASEQTGGPAQYPEEPLEPVANPGLSNEMDAGMASERENQRAQARLREDTSQYHLTRILEAFRWQMRMWKKVLKETKYPTFDIPDSKVDYLLRALIRHVHIMLRKEAVYEQETRGRKRERSPAPDIQAGGSNARSRYSSLQVRRVWPTHSPPTQSPPGRKEQLRIPMPTKTDPKRSDISEKEWLGRYYDREINPMEL
ncbi:hypothetical protein B0T20DRAFT_256760 [Sordaria brevicollis]|uniref:Uncharacterized protein n=1 Tax=Sordaria brevicollis TaxID=83679 RepID=A0AAE0PCH9_SORBR|nr:hypothetical protein B0T20DRAFT_256760 [Sordaria brevicollis]